MKVLGAKGVDFTFNDTEFIDLDALKVTCPKCSKEQIASEPDSCLGKLPGVLFACCGHGIKEHSYIYFENGTIIRGFDRIERRP